MRFIAFFFKFLFLSILFYSIYYIYFIETERYSSSSTVMIKDLSQNQSTSPLGSLLMPMGSNSMRDAKLLEIYINSSDMFSILDREFNLSTYYKSEDIDIIHRLWDRTPISSYLFNMQNILDKYHNDLSILYDEPSSTMEISFLHANPKISQKIVKRIILESSKVLNRFEKDSTEVILKFLKEEEHKKHKLFIESLEILLSYQNKNRTIDPKIDIDVKNTILAKLEGELIEKRVKYNAKSQYLNKKTVEMKLLAGDIEYIKKSIKKIKSEITGKRGKRELNANMSDFTLLKSRVEFNKELYMQTLVKLEETKVLIKQNRKNLIIITQPKVSDSYSSPNKIKESISIFIILTFLYGVISLIITIIRDHKD